MLKVQICSDLHVNKNGNWNYSRVKPIVIPDDAKDVVLVIAGDISPNIEHNIKILQYYASLYRDVIFVLGNHDHDGMVFNTVYSSYCDQVKYKEFKPNDQFNNIHILEKTSIEIDHVIFYGCTGWGNPLHDINSMDFSLIKNFTSDIASIEFAKSKKWVKEVFDTQPEFENMFTDKKKVLITHFPYCKLSALSHLSKYHSSEILEALYNRPDIHIHGHTHQVTDYMYKNTRVICNAFGIYPNTDKFNSNLIIEI